MQTWQCPAELNQPLPREVRETRSVRAIAAVYAAGLLVPLLIILASAFLSAQRKQALKDHGAKTTAVVTGRHEATDSRRNVSYLVDYRFSPNGPSGPAMKAVGGSSAVPRPAYERIKPGDRMEVIYDPASPSKSALTLALDTIWAHPYETPALMAEVLLPFTGGVVAIFFFQAAGPIWKEKKLVRWGTAAPVEILDQKQYATRWGMKLQMVYGFRDPSGREVRGIRRNIPTGPLGGGDGYRLRITMNPVVLYDPADSSRNLLYPPASACRDPRRDE